MAPIAAGRINLAIAVSDGTQVAAARRAGASLARQIGMDENTAGQLAIVVTEAASNVFKHGGGGTILLAVRERRGVAGVEVLALDRGRGMTDPKRCAEDGYSTAGSPGTGLGAIGRLAAVRDLYSTAEGGTALLAWVPGFPSKPSTANEVQPAFEIGGVCLPIAGEVVCGDAWSVNRFPGGIRLLVADGLGHGTGASEAANEALNLAAAHTGDSASELINRIHAGLRATRGAAVAVADVDSRAGVVRYCGLGNITGSVTAPDAVRRQMVSHNGTAGLQARTVREFTYPWPANGLLILHSDGLATHWSLDRYPGLARRDTSLIAGVLFRDFARGRDDATIVAIREKPRLEEVHDVPSSPRG